ncbi:MAG: alpha/beta fold hydrolase [Acidobacteria bacterium]|nr:alpha/beta fold hydrolase [Acidobacteriota bacterium]
MEMSEQPHSNTDYHSSRGGEFDLPSNDVVIGNRPLREYTFPNALRNPRRAIVCVPGFSASGRSFARLAPLSSAWDIRMVNGPLERAYPGDAVDTLAGVIADYAMQFDRPVILGTSFGGLVAISAALRMRGAISGLILTAAFANGTRLGTLPFMRQLIPAMQLTASSLAPITARVVGGPGIDSAGRSAIVEDVLAMPADERARRLRTIFSTNLLPHLEQIDAPALVIHGRRDLLVPKARALEMARALPHCDYHEIRGAGHLPYITHAAEFVALTTAFLERLGRRP